MEGPGSEAALVIVRSLFSIRLRFAPTFASSVQLQAGCISRISLQKFHLAEMAG